MRSLVAILTVVLAGCATTPLASPATGGTCRDTGLAAFVGRAANDETGAAILAASGARDLRWVQPGMMVTMEYSESRVTASVGADRRVERVTCG